MKATIVVPVRNRAALTRQSIDGVDGAYGGRDDVELVVVDDGSTDETASLLESRPRIRVVRHDESCGFAVSCNDGAAGSSADHLVFLNNDAMGEPGWLEALLDHADADEGAGIVGARLLYQNGTIQHAGIVFGADRLPRHVYRGFPRDHPAVTRTRRFQAVTAACMLVRRSLFEKIGGFDSGYANGFDDVDLCLRAGETGAEVHYCPNSVLVHLEAATRGEDEALFRRNADRYLERWGNVVRRDDVDTYLEDGLLELVPGDLYPVELRVSPELAVLGDADPYAVLDARSRQVFDLLKENAALRMRLLESGLDDQRRRSEAASRRSGDV
jgi:GT2 family glycosyltransferase